MSDLRTQREQADERLRRAADRLTRANEELRAAEREHSEAGRYAGNLNIPDVCLEPPKVQM